MAAAESYAEISGPEYGLHRLPHLGDAVLQVLLSDEVRTLREEPCWQMETGRSAKTLVKYPDLRIVLVKTTMYGSTVADWVLRTYEGLKS